MRIAAWWQSVTRRTWPAPSPIPPAPADILGAATLVKEKPGDLPTESLPHVIVAKPAIGSRVLRIGVARGDDVARVQALLGLPVADGWFGPVTAASVAAWQQDHGLLGDGVVGPATWRALGVAGTSAPVVFAAPLAVDGFAVRVERALRAVAAFEPAAWAAVLAPDMARAKIITGARMAGFLSNITHETGGMRRLVEILHYSSPERLMAVWPSRFPTRAAALPYVANAPALAERVYSGRMGNIKPGDGWRFRGRGGYMTTGADNYAALSRATGDALAMLTGDASPLETRAGASRSAAVFWASINGNLLADAGDVRELRRRGNGGFVGLADVQERDKTIRAALA